MTQHVDDPTEERQTPISQQLTGQRTRFSRAVIISLLVVVVLLLSSVTGLLILNLSAGITPAASAQRLPTTTPQPSPTLAPTEETPDLDSTPALFMPNNTAVPPLQLPGGHYVLYEQLKHLYLISTSGGTPKQLTSPGYVFNEAVPPILTPNGQLLYSGDGIWLLSIFEGKAIQIASLGPGQIITSMALSADGTTIAWSTAPINGKGVIDLYAGPLTAPATVYEQPAGSCPCFRIFSFMSGSGQAGNSTLLLTDDRGSLQAVQHGLWMLDLTASAPQTPQLLLEEDPQQGPLVLAPYSNILLYSSNEGIVSWPSDGSVPSIFTSLYYANSLDIAAIDGQSQTLSTSQVILPEQHNLNNNEVYRWVTTPTFSPDGHTLLYVEFSSDPGTPYDRHSALYTVQINGSGFQLTIGKPTLLATSTALFLELGPWLNNHVVTFYGDGTLYALDIQSGAVATILETTLTVVEGQLPVTAYVRIIAVIGTGHI